MMSLCDFACENAFNMDSCVKWNPQNGTTAGRKGETNVFVLVLDGMGTASSDDVDNCDD